LTEGNRVQIDWEAPAWTGGGDIDYYLVEIEQWNERSQEYQFLRTEKFEDTEGLLTELPLDTTFELTVFAHNKVGEGDPSQKIKVRTNFAGPP
jgi:hypothetical protein